MQCDRRTRILGMENTAAGMTIDTEDVTRARDLAAVKGAPMAIAGEIARGRTALVGEAQHLLGTLWSSTLHL